MKSLISICIAIIIHIEAYSQVGGEIIDNNTKKTLDQVVVFVQGSTLSCISGKDGVFSLEGIPNEFVTLVLFKRGYEIFHSSMKVAPGKRYQLNLSMQPVKEKRWKQAELPSIQLLHDKLAGAKGNSEFIFKHEQLTQNKDAIGNLQLKSVGPIIIFNNRLGYEINYFLENFSVETGKPNLKGFYYFSELPQAEASKVTSLERQRLEAYYGSLRHFLRSIASEESKNFNAYDIHGNKLAVVIGKSLHDYYELVFDDSIRIEYKSNNGAKGESWLIKRGSVQFSKTGNILTTSNLVVRGSMSNANQIDLLPSNFYDPDETAKLFQRLYEKTYVMTDKPYYYPGEVIWFRGYMNYKNPNWRDSLSKVAYVEIIQPNLQIAYKRILKIDSGLFKGDIILSDTLKSGTYLLRAYTLLQLNFTTENIFTKSFEILNIREKVDLSASTQNNPNNEGLSVSIQANKPSYQRREKVQLNINVLDKNRMPVASNLSISVTDLNQVIPIQEATILEQFPIHTTPEVSIPIEYSPEFGISYRAQFVDNKGKSKRESLTIMQLNSKNTYVTETDENGIFQQSGLNILDSTTFLFKGTNMHDDAQGKIRLLSPPSVTVVKYDTTEHLPIKTSSEPQRVISEYEVPKDSKLLETIEIKSSRLPFNEFDDPNYRVKRPYGRPDYVLMAKDINTSYGNLLYSLQGKFPGLTVRLTEDGWKIYTQRSVANSIANPTPPLVTINNVAMGGEPANILAAINPLTVESIEVTTRVNVLYGSQGAGGVIAIHTKQEITDQKEISQNFVSMKIPGYSRVRTFNHPQYETSKGDLNIVDYRSTIYWNPEVRLPSSSGFASVSFFAADLPGRYRIIVEGISAIGVPFRATTFVDVSD